MAFYYVWSGAAGSGNGSSWANAAITLTAGFVLEAAGDTLYVAHDHAESTAGAVTFNSQGSPSNITKVVCVNRAGTVPPVSADRRATATVTTTGANNLGINGSAHFDGIIFNVGSGASSSAFLNLADANDAYQRFDNCSFRFPITGSGGGGIFAASGGGYRGGIVIELNNTTMSFSGSMAAQVAIQVTNTFRWRNTPSALLLFTPSLLFSQMSGDERGGLIECIGVDLSAAGSGKTLVQMTSNQGLRFRFVDCKLDAAVTRSTGLSGMSHDLSFIRCGATGNYRVYHEHLSGVLQEETTIVRTGGATDGTTPLSWKIVTSSSCSYSMPYEPPPIAIWCDTTGAAKTATIEGIASALPTDAEIWLDLEYLNDASAPQGAFVNDAKSDLLATAANQTTSTATWGGALTGKFKLAVTFTPLQKGWVYCRVKVGKPSATFYVDPLITLT